MTSSEVSPEASIGLLVVEPDTLVRSPLAEYLRECGYRVVEARTAEEARTLLGSALAPIDIALVDAKGTPEETGFALAHWLRDHHPEIDTILTGAVEGMARKAEEICEEGPSPDPPVDHRILLDRIRRLTAARQRRRTG